MESREASNSIAVNALVRPISSVRWDRGDRATEEGRRMRTSNSGNERPTTRSVILVAAVCLLLVGGGLGAASSAPAHVKVTICHRTNSVSNPYNRITVNLRAVDGDGDSDHQGHDEGGIFDPAFEYPPNQKDWGDIIPPFDENGDPIVDPSFPGPLNWTPLGRAIFEDGDCEVTGELTVTKDLVPADDEGTFHLQIDGETVGTGGDGATAQRTVTFGDHTVGETAAGSTDLAGYTSQVVCRNGPEPAQPQVDGTSATVTVRPGDDWTCTITNTVGSPELSIQKSGGDVASGQDITWTIIVTNSGTADATDVVVTDHLPAGFTFVSASTGCGESGGTVTCTIALVPMGDQVSISITATAPAECRPYTNTASLDEAATGSASGNVIGCVPEDNAVLTIDKHAMPALVGIEEFVVFSIAVQSTGAAAAEDVTLEDTLPEIPGVSWSISGGDGQGACQLNANLLTCGFGEMAPGSSFTVEVSTSTTSTESCGAFTNVATADASNTSPVSDDAEAEVECAGIDLVKLGPSTASLGQTITYAHLVSLKSGSQDLSNILVTDRRCDPGTLSGPSSGDDGDALLEQGKTWHLSCRHLVVETDPDPLPNTATACGNDQAGGVVCDSDNHLVDIV